MGSSTKKLELRGENMVRAINIWGHHDPSVGLPSTDRQPTLGHDQALYYIPFFIPSSHKKKGCRSDPLPLRALLVELHPCGISRFILLGNRK